MATELDDLLPTAAFAFRGYNQTNLGRSRELLEHPRFGATVAKFLAVASQLASDELHESIDLEAVVRRQEPSHLQTFGRDIALILAMELAHVQLLQECFQIEYGQARLSMGYSLGEVAALVAGGVFQLEQVLPPLLTLARDCADLARGATMGVLFSRGPAIDLEAVTRLCVHLSAEGQGLIAMSAQLSPNTVLLLGQGDTIDRFQIRMHEYFPDKCYLRKNADLWPPLHTPLLWLRNIPNRAALAMHQMPGGFSLPHPPIVSLVTGQVSYNDYNSRQLLAEWIDHPQLLWDALYHTLSAGITTLIHVGPEPNLIPATFKRISDNVQIQLQGRSLNSLGLRVASTLWRPWLSRLLSSRTALLHAPQIRHIILEDWLLEHAAKQAA